MKLTKKIIISILGAVFLSIIIGVISPSSFVKDSVQWTYSNQTGRLDVRLIGDIQNGQIDVIGKDVKTERGAWLLSNTNQGVMIRFPVSYFQKSYQISLIPQGDKTGENISLQIHFIGNVFVKNNQRNQAYVKFKNVRINDKLIIDEQTVSHDKPYIYHLKNIAELNPINIEFEIQKPIAFSDISWIKFTTFTGLFILLFCLPFIQKIIQIIFSKIVHFFSFMTNTDIIKVISDGYFRIDRVYRRSFWVIFAVLCFAFGFRTMQFIQSNHDWSILFISRPWGERIWEGRFALHFFKILFLKGIYLPVIHDVITFLVLSLNAVLLCIYWKLPKKIIYFVLCGLILTVQPFTLTFLYFSLMMPDTFIGVTFVLTALLLSEKIAFSKNSMIKKGFLALVCIVLIHLSLAIYQVIINTIAVAFVGRLLIQAFDWNGSWKKFKSCFFPFIISAINIVLGIGLYKIMITFVFPMNSSNYNTQPLPLEKLPERFMMILKQCFYQLYDYPFPFISQPVIWVFAVFTILVALYICFKGNIQQKIIRLLLLFSALLATKTALIFANTFIITTRLELFGLVVFETLVAVLVFTNLKKLHNLVFIVISGVIFVSVINDLDCLRVWKLGFDAEKMMWNRILTRLEIQEDFNINHKYKIIRIGSSIPFGAKFYNSSIKYPQKYEILNSYDPSWKLFTAHEFYYPVSFKDKDIVNQNMGNPEYKAELKRLYEAGILEKVKAWPHQNGLIVWDDIILYVTDEKLLNDYKKRLEKEFPKPKSMPAEDLSESENSHFLSGKNKV